MGKRIVHCGGAGAGQAAKICNNMILGATMIATCEAFVLAEKLGLSAQALFDVASTSSGQMLVADHLLPGARPGAGLARQQRLQARLRGGADAEGSAARAGGGAGAGAATPLGAEAAQLYQLFAAAGRAGDDFSGIIKFLRGMTAEAKSE